MIYFLKVIVWKLLGKNLEFVNLVFRKGSYYFRGSDIGFKMIEDSYKYITQSDFQDKYNTLIHWLDDESKKTIELFIQHIRLFYHNNIVHESELFSDREKNLQKKSFEFMWKNWILHPTWYGLFDDSQILEQIGNWVVLDVWASDGIESMMFAKMLPNTLKIYSFEPSSYNFTCLNTNVGNSMYKDRIILQNIALWEYDGEMEIFGSWWAEVSRINLGNTNIPSEKVKVQTIDTFVNSENIKRVWLIKWDIEWSEIESLLGAKNIIIRDKPVLIVSIYHNGREFFETKPLIESWNLGYRFKIFQSEPGGTWVGVVLICY